MAVRRGRRLEIPTGYLPRSLSQKTEAGEPSMVPTIFRRPMISNSLQSFFRTSLCVFLLSSFAEAETVYFPHVVVGDGYSTIFTLINTDSVPLRGELRVFSQDGSPLATPVEWANVLIVPAGSVRLTLSNTGKLSIASAYF